MYPKRKWQNVAQKDSRVRALERSRRERWNAKGRARVVHPIRGTVVVPSASKFAAMLNAAEVWGCSWMDIRGAEVWLASPEEMVVTRPYII